MKVISVANQKGGCGKTTSCINLGDQFARKGKRTLIIDLDPQSNLTSVLAPQEHQFTTAEVFDKHSAVKLSEAIVETAIDGLWICPSSLRLSRVIEQSVSVINRERLLSKQLKMIEDEFDIVLLDTPPNLSLTSINAMVVADLFLIPVDKSFSLSGLGDMLEMIEEVREGDDVQVGVFRNEFVSRNTRVNNYLDEQLAGIQEYLLKSRVRAAEAIEQASFHESTLRQYQKASVAMNDYQKLSVEILEKLA
ncbi:ParA family protein [Vibrio parahaemolyticus]|nr:ParA family protein [Vibrio parahaemolyticus]